MKTILIYIITATLFNAAALTQDYLMLGIATLSGIVAWKHSKTLKVIKPENKRHYSLEM